MKSLIVIWLLTASTAPVWPQTEAAKKQNRTVDLNEHVDVVNIEMIARVQKGGQPVGGLGKSAFILTENGREVEINGFREVRRRIRRAPEEAAGPNPAPAAPPGRLFVLYFWLWSPGVPYAEALDRFFAEVYRPGDRVLLVHEQGTSEIDSPEQARTAPARFAAELRKVMESARQDRQLIYREIDDAIYAYLHRSDQEDESFARTKMHNRIGDCWKEFRKRFLQGQTDSLKRFAASLKTIAGEKWVLAFLQEDLFPEIRSDSVVPAMENQLEEMARGMGDEWVSFTEAVRSEFIAADATVSLIRCNSRSEINDESPYYRQRIVYSDLDQSLRKISLVTGGAAIADNDLSRALLQAADREDIVYFISFQPLGEKKKSDVRLSCRDTSLEIYACRHGEFDLPAQVQISEARMEGSRLIFRLRGFVRLYEGGRLQGRVQVRVLVNGEGLAAAETSRELTPLEADVQIPVAMRLPRGRYTVVIRALDLHSGLEASNLFTVRNR